VAHGPLMKPLDFGCNPDHGTLGLEWVRVTVRWGITIFCIGG